LPMLHIGGWFDFLMRGTLHLYQAMVEIGHAPQHLIVGPWAHLPWGRHLGGMDYGPQAVSGIDRAQVRWFDHWLKGNHPGVPAQSPVQLFEIGSNQWHRFDRWPQQDSQVTLFLHTFLQTTGLVSMEGGQLSTMPPEDVQEDCLVHDPWRPVPACGGHGVTPAGQLNRAALDDRSDVLAFTTESLQEDWHIWGEVQVQLHVTADQPSFDLSVVLSEVYPDGRVLGFCQGMLRCEASADALRRVTLQAIAIRIPKGHAVRLSLSAACFPAYAVNSGTGTALSKTTALDHQIITLCLISSPDAPSQLQLPLLFT
jgi:uncharacterized protein